jgi:histidinol-phosphatase (PHP family)
MLGLVDYHTHSILSDGHASYEEMVLAALRKGLFEIGFSDHLCIRFPSWALKMIDLPVMTEQVIGLKEAYRNQITIKYGVETDYFPDQERKIAQVTESLPVDYIIGSVHFLGDWNFDGDQSLYGKWSNDELYHWYFGIIQKAAKSKLFDVIGHLDLIKNFNIYPETDQERLFEETLAIIAESGTVVELNTSGPDRPCGEFLPGPRLLELCYKHGINITLGSDAHRPQQIGRHYEQAVELLKKTGFTEIVTFSNRKKSFLRI